MSLPNRLRELRGALSQQEFGRRINVSQGSVRNYEIGDREPDASTIVLICQEFKVSPEWLLFGTSSEPACSPLPAIFQDEEIEPSTTPIPTQAPENRVNAPINANIYELYEDIRNMGKELSRLSKDNACLRVENEQLRHRS